MIITDAQLRQIIAGTLVYASCDACGQGSTLMAPTDRLVDCPLCLGHLDEAGDGWDFGFECPSWRQQYGLGFEFKTGDFRLGY